jgi:hypothetical protein
MKKYVNGEYLDMTPEEIEELNNKIPPKETSYGERVNALIRRRYTVSDELAILRQRDEKPEEFAEYFAYCEECKAEVKSNIQY